MQKDASLKALARLVGEWRTEATHPAFPGKIVKGTVSIEWLEGEQFLIHRARTDHPDFPDSISIIGFSDRDRVGDARSGPSSGDQSLHMNYFDSRGVSRVFTAGIDESTWRLERLAPGFSQRFSGTFRDDDTIVGLWQLCEDDRHWADDLQITYRRRTG